MASTKEQPQVEPYAAAEVRAWLSAKGIEVGSRGRIAVEHLRSYLDEHPDRARQLVKQFGAMPKNHQPKAKDLDVTAALMARPALMRKPIEDVRALVAEKKAKAEAEAQKAAASVEPAPVQSEAPEEGGGLAEFAG